MRSVICFQVLTNILDRLKNYFSQLLKASGVGDFRQLEICAAETLTPGPRPFEVEPPIEKWKRYTSRAELKKKVGGTGDSQNMEVRNNKFWLRKF